MSHLSPRDCCSSAATSQAALHDNIALRGFFSLNDDLLPSCLPPDGQCEREGACVRGEGGDE
jgi:hypothetical protein